MHWRCVLYISVILAARSSSTEVSFTAESLPKGCRWSVERKALNCSSADLTSVPVFAADVAKVVTNLFLKNNNIKNVETNQNFPEVILLDISFSKVETVSEYIGYNFPQLKYLWMNSNRIKNIGWISTISNLRSLNLRNNLVNSLSPGRSFSLVHLNIQAFDLSSNHIADVNPISKWKMMSLESLNFSSNKITDLRDAHFPVNLLQLDFSHNRITGIFPEFMVAIPKVQWLRLAHNELTSMSFLLQNRSQALWKVDLAENKLTCTCDLYRQKVILGRQGVVFGDEPFCSERSDPKTSLFTFGDAVCPQLVSNICQDKSTFHYGLQGAKITWDLHESLRNVNVSWTLIDETGAELSSDSASIAARSGQLGFTPGAQVLQLCMHLSRGSINCLHSCRLLPNTVMLSSTNQILVIVLAITGGCVLLLLIIFFIRERSRLSAPTESNIAYAASMHSLHPSMHGSRVDMLVDTTNLDDSSGGFGMARPMSVISNGNQTVPTRHFIRKQPMAGGPVSMHAKRASLFQSERCLTSASLHSLPNFQSMGRLNSSRQSLASRALPEVPDGSYCEMSNVPTGQEAYEFMDEPMRPASHQDTYQELGYQ